MFMLTTCVFWARENVRKPLQEVMGAKGMVCFGMGFGVLMAMSQGLSKRSITRVSCKAGFEQPGSIVLKEQDTDISKILGMQCRVLTMWLWGGVGQSIGIPMSREWCHC